MKNTILLTACIISVGALSTATVRSQILSENFDSTGIGSIPDGWSRSQPGNNIVQVTGSESVSSPNSLLFSKPDTLGGSPAASVGFDPQSSGILTVSLDLRVSNTSADLLYVKLRNSTSQEIGGVRVFNGNFGYQNPNGTWTNTSMPYLADTWYHVQIDYNLDTETYSAWVNQSLLIADADFRPITTVNGASLLFQAAPNVGTGNAYLDNVQVIPEPATSALIASILLLAIALTRKHYGRKNNL